MDGHQALEEFVARVRSLSRQALLDAAAVDLLEAFDTAGVESRLLKGPALSRLLYLPGEHRGYSDLDLLLDVRALVRAQDALTRLGYRSESEDRGIDDVAGILHSEVWSQPLEKERVVLMVDLHWRLPGCDASAETTWEVLSSEPAWIELNGRRAAVLSRERLALHLATHAAQHGPRDLKAMADLSRGVARWDAGIWRSAAHIAEQLDGTPAFAAGLRLISAGAELAGELELPPSDELEWSIRNRDARPRGTFHLQALGRAAGLRARLDLVRRALLPPSEWITWEYRWAADRRLLVPLAYGIHILRAPAWGARAWLYRRRERRVSR